MESSKKIGIKALKYRCVRKKQALGKCLTAKKEKKDSILGTEFYEVLICL